MVLVKGRRGKDLEDDKNIYIQIKGQREETDSFPYKSAKEQES